MLHIHVHPSERCLPSRERHLSSGRFGLVAGDAGGWFIKPLGTQRGQDPEKDGGAGVS